MNEALTQKVQKELKDNYLTYKDLCPHTGYTLGTIKVFFSRGLTDTQADEMLSAIEAIKEERRKNVKTPQELKEEFDKLSYEEKKAIHKGYEALGMEVVKQNGKEFREWCLICYSTRNDAKKRNTEQQMARLRRWFRGDLHNWMVTDMTGDEWCDKIERITREEAKRRRK